MKRTLLSLCLSVAAAAQQYPFLPVPGAPRSVRLVFEDRRGRIWTAGEELAVFDGARFFHLRDYGMPPGDSYDVEEDAGGAVWIGAERGVFRFAGGRVEQLAAGVAVSVIPVSPGMALAAVGAAGKGMPRETRLVRIRRKGAHWTVETLLDLDTPGPLTADGRGNLLFPEPGRGFGEVRADRPEAGVTHHAIPRFPSNGPLKVLRDRAGCLWTGASGGVDYDCGQGSHAVPYAPAVSAWMHDAADGTMVISGPSVLVVGRPGHFQVAGHINGLPGVADAIQARDGTVWIGGSGGLYRFASPFRIEFWTIRDGLADPPWSVARVGQRVFVGLDHKIARLSADRSRWETIADLRGGGVVSALLGTRSGTLLATQMNGGAVELTPRGGVLARTPVDNPKCCSMRLAQGEGGETWMSGSSIGKLTRDGNVLRLDERKLASQPSGNALALRYRAEAHTLWGCYNGGLVKRDAGGNWTEYTTRDGLAVNGCWSLAPLANGDIWYAYYNLRAFARLRFDGAGKLSVHQFGPDDGTEEPANDVFEADRTGRLWRSGERGIYVADSAMAEARQWLRLDSGDGFPADAMNSGSVFEDVDGSMWWGADNDLAHFWPPADFVPPKKAPEVFVSGISWEGTASRLADAVASVPPGARTTIHMGSLRFEGRSGLRFRFRLLPEQRQWRESTSLDLDLGAPAEGAHRLEVQARMVGGPWSGAVVWPFEVRRLWWLTWPALSADVLLLGLLGGGAMVWARRRKAEAAQLLPDLAAWRMGALLPDAYDLAGTLLDGRFRVGELLARGGFAYVMEGYDTLQMQACAIKVFRSEVKEQPWVQRRFRQEVAALERVRHANVVAIYAHGQAPSGAPYLVMEFVAGECLRETLERGALEPARAARLLRQLGGALAAIHAQAICHRDVKPENVIVRAAGSAEEQAVLIDFSIAIVKEADETLHGLSRAAGTFDYMSPEQAIGYAQPSSDIYSLAKIAIEMLTGRRIKELLPDAALDLPERVRELLMVLRLGLSEQAIELLARALEFDPARRPSDAAEFAGRIARDLD